MVDLSSVSPGTVVGGEFEIVRAIGHGGMGAVYLATQRGTGAMRALKMMHAALAKDARLRERFVQEARVGSLVRSDHVVQVLGAGVDDATGAPWLAMELLEGSDLGALVRDAGPLSVADVHLLMGQLCHALAAAHRVGVVHRDLKPENVFLSPSRAAYVSVVVKVLDFGVAKLMSELKGATMAIGTPAYMAPEQAQTTKEVGPHTDVWAVGLVAFYALVGKSFWKAAEDPAAEANALFREILLDPIPAATLRAAELGRGEALPPGFDAWFARCVDRSPVRRFPTAAEAGQELEVVLGPIADRAPGTLARALSSRPMSSEAASETTQAAPLPSGEPPRPPAASTWVTPAALPEGARGPSARVVFRERGERVIVDGVMGTSVLDVSLKHGLPHAHACGGHGKCTTCRVVVLEGAENLSPRTEREQVIARRKAWPETVRLACQARVLGPVSVRKLVMDAEGQALAVADGENGLPTGERDVVVLSFGLRNLDELARKNLAFDMVHVVSRMLRHVAEPVEANRGLVTSIGGDGCIAVFGIDGASPADAARGALRAALRALSRVTHSNAELERQLGMSLAIGAGLSAGKIVVGSFGARAQGGVTCFGDAISAAGRVEHAGRKDAIGIAIDDAARALLADEIRVGRSAAGHGESVTEVIDFAVPDVTYIVQSTFERVIPRATELAAAFYERLFDSDPEIAALFDHVNMTVQRDMLMSMLAVTVRGLDKVETVLPALRDLGARHVGYGVRVAHYRTVGEALLFALERFLGNEFTPEVEIAWREIYGLIARTMMEPLRDAKGTPSG
jgi:serine/threonine protein kinase/ferredoxin/hemoglobin-like flavoprotein